MKYFGKKYISGDNSHTQSLVTKEWFPLAGTKWDAPVESVIVSEPYEEKIEFFGTTYSHKFINVMYNHTVYRVLFFDWCVERQMLDAIDQFYFEYFTPYPIYN